MSEHTKLHKASHILIDARFGSALIQEAKTADFSVIAVKAEYDKKSEWPYKPAKSMKAL